LIALAIFSARAISNADPAPQRRQPHHRRRRIRLSVRRALTPGRVHLESSRRQVADEEVARRRRRRLERLALAGVEVAAEDVLDAI
jgi:hypothetical protein